MPILKKAPLLFRYILYVLLGLLILFAILVSIARAFTPVLNQYRPQIIHLASKQLQHPVDIAKISATWHWLQPVIKLNDVKIMENNGSQEPLIQIAELDVGINLLSSFFNWQIKPGSIFIEGTTVHLIQQTDKQWQLVGWNIKTEGKSNDDTIQRLFAINRISLKEVNVFLQPLNYQPFSLTNAHAQLLSFGRRHFIDAQLLLTAQQSIVPVELTGTVINPNKNLNDAESHIHIIFQNIDLQTWLHHTNMGPYTIAGKLPILNIHSHFIGKQLEQLRIDFSAEALNIQKEKIAENLNLDFTQGQLTVNHNNNNWQILLNNWQTKQHGQLSQKNNAELDATIQNKDNYEVTFKLDNLALVNLYLLPLLPMNYNLQNIINMVQHLQPSGEIQQLGLAIIKKNNVPLNYIIDASLQNVAWKAWNKIPGMTQVSGRIHTEPTQSIFTLNGQNSVATFLKVFRKPILLNKWNAAVTLKQQADVWNISSKDAYFETNAGSVTSQLNLSLPNNQSPIIDLSSDVNANQLTKSDIYHYLPVGILPSSVVTWLDTNIKYLGKTHATLQLKGPLNDFPFDDGKGAFVIQAQFRDTSLQFSEGWPTATGLAGTMIFSGRSMDIITTQGNIEGATLLHARAQIPYMGAAQPVILQITGQAKGDTSQVLTFLHTSPLKKYLQQGLDSATGTGPFHLDLGLQIPLSTESTPKIDGKMQFKQATLTIPTWDIMLNNIQGLLQFSEDGLQAQQIDANLFNLPVKINLVPPSANNQQQTQIQLATILDLARLSKDYNIPLNNMVFGKAKITGQIAINPDKSININISSNLNGIQINLPLILKKPATQNAALNITGKFLPNQLPLISFTYSNQAAGIFQFKSEPSYSLNAGNLIIGSNKIPVLPPQGMEVTTVLPICSTSVWQSMYNQLKPVNSTSKKKGWPAWLSAVNVNCGQLLLGNFNFTQTDLTIAQRSNDFLIQVQSPQALGNMVVPAKNTPGAVQLKFSRLYLYPQGQSLKSSISNIKPNAIPLTVFSIDDLRYGSKLFGNVSGKLQPQGQNLAIQMNINQGAALASEINAIWDGNPVNTTVSGHLNSNDVAQMVKNLGLPGNLISHSASGNFSLTWPGPPYQLLIRNLNGNVNVQINNGVIIGLGKNTDAKVGFTRVLNSLSLQNIPDKLKGLTNEQQNGFIFSKLVVKLQLNNGIAYIQQGNITSPIANISMAGTLNLAAQTYDATMIVIPHLTSSVPVAATLVGGPILGAVAWVADKALSPAVNALAQYHYKITGTWQKPVITKI